MVVKQTRPVLLGPRALRGMPLPRHGPAEDKEGRGRVLVVGGSAEMPGSAVLAATAALRAGAGKLRIATTRGVAPHVACAVPEARVFPLPESRAGGITRAAAGRLAELAEEADALCIGPGMIDRRATARLLEVFLPRLGRPALVLDADALGCLAGDRRLLHGLARGAVVTPNADELEELFGACAGEGVRAAQVGRIAQELGAVVVAKGRETLIAGPEGGHVYANRAGNVGLATSGTGDVLAGLIAGLAARGARPLAAAAWGVHAHAIAGDRLARRVGPLGYLARELLEEIPAVLSSLAGATKR